MKRAVFYAAAALSLFGSLAGQANAQAVGVRIERAITPVEKLVHESSSAVR
jgi:hypothetical protein